MEMFLMVASLSLLGVAVSTVLFAAATREPAPPQPQTRPAETFGMPAPQFFVRPDVRPRATPVHVPIEALLLQIERHVQLEQAAAENFHFTPTAESLHTRTMSPLVH